jgi:hypothetical protein
VWSRSVPRAVERTLKKLPTVRPNTVHDQYLRRNGCDVGADTIGFRAAVIRVNFCFLNFSQLETIRCRPDVT